MFGPRLALTFVGFFPATLLISQSVAPAQAQSVAPAQAEGSTQGKAAATPATQDKPEPKLSAATLAGMKLRGIGPAITSGRVSDIAVDPTNTSHWYVAVAAGGVWETHNCGTTWKPIFDSQKSYSIGCIAIDPRDPLTVWVGTGENNSQRAVAYGDGVYKSIDGGKTWKNVGLGASEHIGKISIDPRDSDRVFVAAQGPLWSAGGDRGVYLTEDGGTTWSCVLSIDEHTGVTDITMDPRNPDVIVAASYQRRRHVFTLINGGPGSGLHKTDDGGKTWRASKSGLPGGDLGRIGLARASARPDTVYAIVEAERGKGGFYRSTDGGGSWHRRNSYVSRSPQYYQELFVDPNDADRVYSMDVYMQVTDDGGKTWSAVGEANKHVDNHAFWIDSGNSDHLVAGCDGGVYESYDRGGAWQFKANLPITQFYKITADNAFPFYNVYGGTQDNFSLGAPARTTSQSGITNREWFMTLGGDGFETVVDPTDADVIYSQWQYGNLVRYDRRTGETLDIKPRVSPDGEPLVWNWNSPVLISPHSHTRLYFAANYLFRSDDRGHSWRAVSGNLTRGTDRNQLEVMGRVWQADAVSKNRSTSIYGNIVALAESSVREGRLWVGTDDGLVHTTGDGGANWHSIDGIEEIPDQTYVSALAASSHDGDTVYAAFDNHKRGDFKPYLMRSRDAGVSWTSIAGDLPERGTVHTVVEDHVDPDLLFCGTEFGVFVTRDGGARWLRLKGGIPTIAVRDLEIQRRENDLVVGTFGRGIFILDNYAPLRAMSEEVLQKKAALFPIARAWQFIERRPLGRGGKGFLGDAFYTAPNPPTGAVFTYHLSDGFKSRKQERHATEATARKKEEKTPYPTWNELRAEDREQDPQVMLVVRDAHGRVVRRVPGKTGKGLHRVSWDLRHAAPSGRGPLVVPGRYAVTVASLVTGAWSDIAGPEEFDVEVLPGAKFPSTDREAVLAFQQRAAQLSAAVRATSTAAAEAATRLDNLDKALVATAGAEPAWFKQAHTLRGRLVDVRVQLDGDSTVSQRYGAQVDSISTYARTALASFGSTSEPTATHRETYAIAARQLDGVLERLRKIEQEIKSLEDRVEQAGGPPARGQLPKRIR